MAKGHFQVKFTNTKRRLDTKTLNVGKLVECYTISKADYKNYRQFLIQACRSFLNWVHN